MYESVHGMFRNCRETVATTQGCRHEGSSWGESLVVKQNRQQQTLQLASMELFHWQYLV